MESYHVMSEENLRKNVLFKVEDREVSAQEPNRASNSLPPTLNIRESCMQGGEPGILGVWSKSGVTIPEGTRFGPYCGRVIFPHNVSVDMDKKYFWRIYDKATNRLQFIRDGKDTTLANWMRYVQPGVNMADRNLLAYQEGQEVYFLAIRPISSDEELFVWYSKEFSARTGMRDFNGLKNHVAAAAAAHHHRYVPNGATSNLEDDKEEAVRQLQHVLASRKSIIQQNGNVNGGHAQGGHHHHHGGHSSPASESSGYMSNVSPQNRVASASPPASSEDALDLSTDHRRHSSSRSSPTFGGQTRSTPSPQIKEEMTLNYHHERSQVQQQQPQPLATLPLPGGPRLTFNPACIQTRRDSIDLEGMRLEAVRHMPLQPPPAVLAMARPLPPPPVSLPQVRFSDYFSGSGFLIYSSNLFRFPNLPNQPCHGLNHQPKWCLSNLSHFSPYPNKNSKLKGSNPRHSNNHPCKNNNCLRENETICEAPKDCRTL